MCLYVQVCIKYVVIYLYYDDFGNVLIANNPTKKKKKKKNFNYKHTRTRT